MPPKPSPSGSGKRRASDAAGGPQQTDLRDAFGVSPKLKRKGSLAAEAPLEVQVTPRQYDAFTVKFLETEGTARGFSAADKEEDARRSETEFVAAFDVLLRNHREFVPPQHFFERLTHALLRRRDCVKSAVKDDDDGDDATAEPAKKKTEAAKKQEASLVAREDDRLLRSTIEIFRKVNEHHPCCFAARFPCALPKTTDQESLKPWEENATNGEAHVRVGTRTWTPLDSDRRAGSIRDQVVDHADIDLTTGAFTRGARADWARFHAMVRAMRGDLEPMEALIAPHDGGSHGNNGDGKTTINTRTASRSARANARNAYADADFNLDKDKDKDKDADADLDDNAYDSDIEETPLGVSLLWTHAVDVLVQDANARIEVFESRVSERAEELAAIAALASVATPTAKKPETESTGRAPDDSPVPDSQPTPVAGDGDDGNSASDKNGTWAVDVLRNTLLFRLVANHAPSDSDRTRLFTDLLELAGVAAKVCSSRTEQFEYADGGSDPEFTQGSQPRAFQKGSQPSASQRGVGSTKAEGKKVANRVGRVTSGGEVSDISPGREDASPTSIGQSANALLHAFDSLLSCAQSHGATRNDRAFEKLRAQLDDSVVRYFRSDRKCLRKPTTKKKFLEQLSFGNAGQDETRGLRIVRGALREKVTSRRAPGIMRPGLGVTRNAGGACDVFKYVADDARDAVKSMEFDDSSVKRHEACAITAHFLAAAAKAAVRMCGADGPVIGDVSKQFKQAADAFALEASQNHALTSAAAAAVDCASGILTMP